MKKEPDFVHPALDKKGTTVVNLRAMPNSLHMRLKVGAIQRGVTLEQHIIDLLDAAAANLHQLG